MAKLWAGRTSGMTDKIADDFNSSIAFDSRMYKQDIAGSMAHAAMLGKQGIITQTEADILVEGLAGIAEDIDNGKLDFDLSCEDVHMFIEQVLTQRVGDVGKKLHTARSRNDQVALDMRMYVRDYVGELTTKIKKLISALVEQAEKNQDSIMPGYTHLQRAHPVTMAHHLLAYCMMLLRDVERFTNGVKRLNVSPIGSCALAGTTYDTDRAFEAKRLGFDSVCQNSMDGVSDRDFCLEIVSACAITMMHLSRLCEELVLWTSLEFGFVELSDAFTTGSSIMPQKKNSDMAELVRGKTGRVYGDLMALLTMLKGLPLAYNKDMQEDKESVFDAMDTLAKCLDVTAPMIATMTAKPDKMKKAAAGGFINATDLADYMTKKGVPFREAYKISGQIVAECIGKGKTLEELSLDEYKAHSDVFDSDLYQAIALKNCVEKRTSEGGTSLTSVQKQLAFVKGAIAL